MDLDKLRNRKRDLRLLLKEYERMYSDSLSALFQSKEIESLIKRTQSQLCHVEGLLIAYELMDCQ